MFNILFTEDILNDKFYFSKSIGDTIPLDPAKKFEAVELEDGTKSVTTKIYKSFGTKQSMNAVWETIDQEKIEDVDNTVPEAEEPEVKIEKPEVLIIKEVTAKLEADAIPVDDIVLPDPITKPATKKTK